MVEARAAAGRRAPLVAVALGRHEERRARLRHRRVGHLARDPKVGKLRLVALMRVVKEGEQVKEGATSGVSPDAPPGEGGLIQNAYLLLFTNMHFHASSARPCSLSNSIIASTSARILGTLTNCPSPDGASGCATAR